MEKHSALLVGHNVFARLVSHASETHINETISRFVYDLSELLHILLTEFA